MTRFLIAASTFLAMCAVTLSGAAGAAEREAAAPTVEVYSNVN